MNTKQEDNCCPICLTNKIRDKCNDCLDGGVCGECYASYCPSGWSYTTNKDETKCPVCRQIQYKWIYSECVEQIVDDCVYQGYNYKPVMDILIRNVCDEEQEEEEIINMSKEDIRNV